MRAFLAILNRDLYVTVRQLHTFLAQVLMQPLFYFFVFGRVLPALGLAKGDYSRVLVPGLLALSVFLTGLQATATPLVVEFGWTREIEARLLAPIATELVAIEKVIHGAIRALIAGAVIFPISWIVTGTLPLDADRAPLVAGVLVLIALVGSSAGLALGTIVDIRRINVVFSLVLPPMVFTGCSLYPWSSLDKLVWFQYLTLLNPLTFASEAMRAAMTPDVKHMEGWISGAVLGAEAVGALGAGMVGFLRRSID